MKQDVLLRILEIIDRHGAEIAFPTSTVHMPGGLSIAEPAAVGMAAGESTTRHPRAE